ncbi:MAG: YkgJ family cysteine cluster protein [Bacteroidota bacterium]
MKLPEKYSELLDRAVQEKAVIKKELERMKSKKPKVLDDDFHSRHNDFFKKNDCLTCGNCCKTTSPIFRDVDIKRISKGLRMKESKFIDEFLRMDDESDYVLKTAPCSFLGTDNKCSIYEIRPLACREYPHTDRKNMFQILQITEKNTQICPAVATIVFDLINK